MTPQNRMPLGTLVGEDGPSSEKNCCCCDVQYQLLHGDVENPHVHPPSALCSLDVLERILPFDRPGETQPAAIFRPKSADEVPVFIRTIRPYALKGEAPLAILGARQLPALECNNIQGGITLNLSLLTSISVKDDTVSVAAGERWRSVYEKLDILRLSVVGGRSAKNGIDELALHSR